MIWKNLYEKWKEKNSGGYLPHYNSVLSLLEHDYAHDEARSLIREPFKLESERKSREVILADSSDVEKKIERTKRPKV